MAENYNPIIGREEISGLRLFQSRPKPEPGIALVLFKEGQPLVTLWPGDRLTAGEVRWGGYKAVYRVDVTEHTFDFNCTLPCRGDAFDFLAEVRVTYIVSDPGVIVKRNTTDARDVLKSSILETMRRISRKFDVDESDTAETAIIEAIKNENYDVGFKVNRFVAELSLEKEERDYIRKQRDIKRSEDLEGQSLKKKIKLTKMKMDFYGPLIEKGDWQMLVLRLSESPEDVASVMQVMQMMSQQRQAETHRQLEIMKIMLEGGALEGFQLEETGKRVLKSLIESLGPQAPPKALDAGDSKERKALSKGKKSPKPEVSKDDDEGEFVEDDE
jgi:hypothetical protein